MQVQLKLIIFSGPDIGGDDDDEDEDEPKPSTSAGGATANGGRKEKTPQQQLGEKLVKHIVEKVDGECYSFRYDS